MGWIGVLQRVMEMSGISQCLLSGQPLSCVDLKLQHIKETDFKDFELKISMWGYIWCCFVIIHKESKKILTGLAIYWKVKMFYRGISYIHQYVVT